MLRRLLIVASLAILIALLCLWPRARKTGDGFSYLTRADTCYGIGTHPGGISFWRTTNLSVRRPEYDPISPNEQRPHGFLLESYRWDETPSWFTATAQTPAALPTISPSSQPTQTSSAILNTALASTTATPDLPADSASTFSNGTVFGSALITLRIWRPPEHHFLGFGYGRTADQWVGLNGKPVEQAWTELEVPFWFLCLLLAIPPAYWIPATLRRRRRRLTGQCIHCGYDLRGTPNRCPECGASPDSPSLSAAATGSSR